MIELLASLAQQLIASLSYLGVFLAGLIGTSTIFLPVPAFLILMSAAALGLNPLLVAFLSAAGQSLGELTGYAVGVGGKKVLEKKYSKQLRVVSKWFRKNGFITIFVFAATPLPDDLVGVLAGFGRYELKKFLLASFLGKICLSLLLAFAGAQLPGIPRYMF